MHQDFVFGSHLFRMIVAYIIYIIIICIIIKITTISKFLNLIGHWQPRFEP